MMKIAFLCTVMFAALVSNIEASCHCDEDFSGFGTEPGKCGCCPWPCCCKCVEITSGECTTTTQTTTTATTTTKTTTTATTATTTTILCPCLDLTFIVDESGSISETQDWPEMLGFCQVIVDFLYYHLADECGDIINVAFITFGTNATLRWDFMPSQDTDILGIVQGKKQTNPVEAIDIAVDDVYGDRESDCIPTVIYITDGRAEFRQQEIPRAGADLREAVNGNVYCIGVTTRFNKTQMDEVCPPELGDRQYSTLGFDTLIDEVSEKLKTQIVAATIGRPVTRAPTTEPPPTEPPTTPTTPTNEPCDPIIIEECFCCCTPEQFWGGMGRSRY